MAASVSGHGHHHHHHDDHGHGHHHHGPPPGGFDRRYVIGIGLNLAFVAVEFVAGVLAHSTALMADAGHNLSDVLGLALAGGAALLAGRAASSRRTYGFGKATVLAALANALVLVFASGVIALEAVQRLWAPQPVASTLVMAVAGIGFVINLATALMFMRGRHDDMNVRGAFLHMAADAAVSLGVVVAGLLILLTGQSWIDPVASLIIVGVILAGTWGLLRESLDLALDAAPARIDMQAVQAALLELPGVTGAHDVHVWGLSTTETAMTAHLIRAEGADDDFLAEARARMKARFGVGHLTLQVEPSAQDHCFNC